MGRGAADPTAGCVRGLPALLGGGGEAQCGCLYSMETIRDMSRSGTQLSGPLLPAMCSPCRCCRGPGRILLLGDLRAGRASAQQLPLGLCTPGPIPAAS